MRITSLLPNERNHWAMRLDGLAVIFEGELLTVLLFRTKLSQIFNVALTSITATTTGTIYGPVATFKYLNVNKLRMGIFGGLTAIWEQSHEAALQYLSDYKDLWGGITLPK